MHDMAKYLILIYGDDREWEAMPEDERRKLYEAHRAFSASAGAAIISSEELQPSPLATTLRTDSAGRLTTTDGPFLETKEARGA